MSSTTDGDEHESDRESSGTASGQSTVVVTDDSGTFTWISPDTEDVFGYTAEEMIELGSVAALFDGEPVDRERVRREGIVDDVETTVTTADGTERTVQVTARRVPFGEGTTMYSVRDVTGRVERDRQYHLHQTVLETTDIVEFAFDTDGVFTLSRGKALDRLGLEDGEAVGESVFDLFGDHPTIPDLCRRALDGETVDATVSQQGRTFDVHFEPIVTDGEVTQVVGLSKDVTELRELEKTYREIFETVSDGLVIHDPGSGEILDVNERFCEMNGYSREALVGEHVSLVSAPDPEYSKTRANELIDRAREEGPQLFEWRNQRKDGEIFPVEVNLRVATIRDQERVLASVRDVSDRKERERELERSERRYRTLAENIPNGAVFMFDSESRYQIVAGRGFDTIDAGPKDFEGKHIEEIYDGETLELIRESHEATLQGESLSHELSYAGKVYQIHTAPITDEHGDIFAGLVIAQNITDRTERERQLEQLREVLGRVVRHDLRNALTVIRNRAELVTEETGPHEHVDRIIETADKLLERSEKALLITKLTDSEPEVMVHDLTAIVSESISVIRTSYPDVEIVASLEECRVEGTHLLREAVDNLVENAVEHNDATDPEVRVSIERGDRVRLIVEDNGPPIPEMEVQNLDTVEERPLDHGSGVGLQLVRLIATRSGGRLQVERGEGGNRVELQLPTPEDS